MNPHPITLFGRYVCLEPLHIKHAEDLFHAGNNPEIWNYMPRSPLKNIEDTNQWIQETIEASQSGQEILFAIIDRETNQAVGSTRYLDIQPENDSLEIGWTWIGTKYQRTPINTETKYLMLCYAFETLRTVRVQLKTDGRNIRSQKAIERIGAVREGVLRKHRRMWDSHIRDTVYYSILDTEWPAVKNHLEELLSR